VSYVRVVCVLTVWRQGTRILALANALQRWTLRCCLLNDDALRRQYDAQRNEAQMGAIAAAISIDQRSHSGAVRDDSTTLSDVDIRSITIIQS
jgi:hypothetical protein